MPYTFTNNWFGSQLPIHTKIFNQYINIDEPLKILEIGSHEGRSTTFFVDNCLTNDLSSVDVIDPWDTNDLTSPVLDSTENLFINNIKQSKHPNKVNVYKGYSNNILPELITKKLKYDYILIDGSHLTKDVLLDAVLCFELLKDNGIIFFDDYLGGSDETRTTLSMPFIGINAFLTCYHNKIIILHSGYHMVIQKI